MSHLLSACVRCATLLLVLGLTAPLTLAQPDTPIDPPPGGDPGPELVRVIVEFEDPPIVQMPGIPRDARQKLILDHPVAQGWKQHYDWKQLNWAAALQDVSSLAVVDWRWQYAYNGAAVRLPAFDIPAVLAMPGVRDVWPQRRHEPTMDVGPQVTGASDLWAELGGQLEGGAGVKVAVLDYGIWPTHEFFTPLDEETMPMPAGFPKGEIEHTSRKIIAARHFYRADDPVDLAADYDSVQDPNGHGTHTAGTIGGTPQTTGGGEDVSGIAPACYLMAYKILYNSEKGEAAVYDGEAISALEAALLDGADIVSNSYGHALVFDVAREPQQVACSNLVEAGLVVVFAAGNDRNREGVTSILAPGANPDVITVGNAGNGKVLALWTMNSGSSIGPNQDFSIKPDIIAPGTQVLSSNHVFGQTTNPDSTYVNRSGTSMACPHIAGICALLKQAHPEWTPAQVKSALMTTAGTDVMDGGSAADVTVRGAGNVRALHASDPGVLLSQASVSFGLMSRSSADSVTITVDEVSGTSETYTITVNELIADAGVVISPTPSPLALAASGSGELEVDVTIGAAVPHGDYEGEIELTGDNGHSARIMYWLRVVPDAAANPVLLIDHDLASSGDDDVREMYTAALDAIGVGYDVWDVQTEAAMPAFTDLIPYRAVIAYSGNSLNPAYFTKDASAALIQYQFAGGHLALLGWQLAYLAQPDSHTTLPGAGAHNLGRLLQYRFGSVDLFGASPIPTDAVLGRPGSPFAGMTFDIAPGAGDNRDFLVDLQELTPEWIFIPDLSTAALRVISASGKVYDGDVGIFRSASQSLETPDEPADIPFRVLYTTFGVESISDDTGADTRRGFLEALLDWMLEKPELDVQISYTAGTDTATVFVDVEGATGSTWHFDFGDGSEIVSQGSAGAQHTFLEGVYEIRTAVTTAQGHTYLGDTVELTITIDPPANNNGGNNNGNGNNGNNGNGNNGNNSNGNGNGNNGNGGGNNNGFVLLPTSSGCGAPAGGRLALVLLIALAGLAAARRYATRQ